MNYLSVEGLTKTYGERVLFKDISFGLSRGDKYALIANNGAGKSSILKIIAGEDVGDSGKVATRDGVRIGYLRQEPVFEESHTINELIHGEHSYVQSVIKRYNKAVEAQAGGSSAGQKEFEEASALMDQAEAWDYEPRIKSILSKFGFTDFDQKVDELSGGQRKRLALALVILDNPELLLLDEPTNHLDVDMIEWLEKYLSNSKITLLMVTHDRYFLDRVCNHILEMSDGKLYHHKGNYSYFLEKRAEREEVYATEIEKAKKLMKKEQEWVRRMPKARTTKSKSRVDAFYELKEKASSGKKELDIKLEVKAQRIGGKILELKKVTKAYGDNLLIDHFDYIFKKGERIGIVGKNGVGKSTFLNIITGREKADSGKVNTGDSITYGYYSQEGIKLKEDKRVIDVLKDVAEVIELANGSKLSASQFLQHFMFTPDMQYTYVSKLSGGERRRLYLMMVLIKNPNFLILDEPTNDLDLLTLSKLEEFLLSYNGCVLIVSHDRYFMDVLVDHLFVFKGNAEIKDFNGTYSEYRAQEVIEEKQHKEQTQQAAKDTPAKEKKKLTYKEKLEYEALEGEIATLEKEKEELEAKLAEGLTDYAEIEKISHRVGEIVALVDEKTMRWLELDEMSA